MKNKSELKMDINEHYKRVDVEAARHYLNCIEANTPNLSGITEVAFTYPETTQFAIAYYMTKVGITFVFKGLRPAAKRYAGRVADELLKALIDKCNERLNNQEATNYN